MIDFACVKNEGCDFWQIVHIYTCWASTELLELYFDKGIWRSHCWVRQFGRRIVQGQHFDHATLEGQPHSLDVGRAGRRVISNHSRWAIEGQLISTSPFFAGPSRWAIEGNVSLPRRFWSPFFQKRNGIYLCWLEHKVSF